MIRNGSDRSSRTLGPAVAGNWYPANPSSLGTLVDEMVAKAPVPPGVPDEVLALIEPHAGLMYSGAVAAHGFRAVESARYDRVIVIGPSHYVGFRGAALPQADGYRTPLGTVPIDVEALDALRAEAGFRTDNEAFRPEHSLEAEIPFLQRVLEPGFRLVPVLVGGGSSGAAAEQVAVGLKRLLAPETLVVVSSDFTHFGPNFGYVPFRRDIPERIRELDMGAVRFIEAGDVSGFESYLAGTGATVCGRDAIEVLLRMLPAGVRCSLLAYDTSGRMTGDWNHSVSYAALVFRGGDTGAAGRG